MCSSGCKRFGLVRESAQFFALPCGPDSWDSLGFFDRFCHQSSVNNPKSPGSTREIVRSIGITDLLNDLSHRSGSLRVHAYSAILLTHLCMPGAIMTFQICSHSYLCRRGCSRMWYRFSLVQGASHVSHFDRLENKRSRISRKFSSSQQLLVERKKAHCNVRKGLV